MKLLLKGRGNTYRVMHYCCHFQHRSKVLVWLRQSVYSSGMEVNPSECAKERLYSVFRYLLAVKKSETREVTVVYLTSYLFSSLYSSHCNYG